MNTVGVHHVCHDTERRVNYRSVVTPLIKKPNLDRENPSNYRPVSNLNNIFTHGASISLKASVSCYKKTKLQSISVCLYRPDYSTETALFIIIIIIDIFKVA